MVTGSSPNKVITGTVVSSFKVFPCVITTLSTKKPLVPLMLSWAWIKPEIPPEVAALKTAAGIPLTTAIPELMLSVTFVILEDKLELVASAPSVSTIFITKSSCWKLVNPAEPLSTAVFPCFLM